LARKYHYNKCSLGADDKDEVTLSLCLLSLSQKLKAPSEPAVANVWCTLIEKYVRMMIH